ncbi:undecaprenyl-phosphate galactose phosphotransferase WbaP [Bacteroidetes/Chlorobi group bacterium ChocPot_Mid]|jgi:Undecaprenyl-phosphate galactose phosphotransferase WbaP|nr:MAG: undecaprenyl-phosphate galactose phosphotransferase WbaP [Bacteroidetes/Chlorobi group bacterium ChocPot_Mid]
METLDLRQLTELVQAQNKEFTAGNKIFFKKFSAGMILMITDIVMLATSVIIALTIRETLWHDQIDLGLYLQILPFVICLFPFAFYIKGLYPGFGIDPIEELRILTYSSTIVFAILATASFLFKGPWDYSRFVFLLSWLLALILVPVGRSFIKKYFSKKNWWGVPVMIIGAGEAGERVIKSLNQQPSIGLKPIVAIDDDSDKWGYMFQVPVVGGLDTIPTLSKKLNIDHAIIAMPKVARKRQKEIIQNYSKYFSSTTVIPDLFGVSSLWVSTRDLGGILGLEVQQRLLKKSSFIKKRIFDIILASTLSILVLPFAVLISILSWLDSKGGIFFRQERMGINDSRFKIIKFRTMRIDAEKRLHDVLAQNDELRNEYNIYHKLKKDPRLTRVGKILRKFSFDEIPQFINVIKGEMSMIGPRAYMPWEKVKMNGHDEIILNVLPGISGLWQVTDRNASSFEERLYTDVYYIRNWSMFLDIYILARTIGVVFLGRGA